MSTTVLAQQEATALVARLHILTVTFAEIDRALGRVADSKSPYAEKARSQVAAVKARAN